MPHYLQGALGGKCHRIKKNKPYARISDNVIDHWSTFQKLKRYSFEIFLMMSYKNQQHLFIGALQRVKYGIFFHSIAVFNVLSQNNTDSW